MKSIIFAIIVLISIGITNQAKAENPITGKAKVDSLVTELNKAKVDSNKVKLLVDISDYYSHVNPDIGIKYANRGLILAKKIKSKKLEAICYLSLGYNYKRNSNYAQAMEYFTKALQINEKINDKSGMANSIGRIAGIYLEQSNFPKSLENFQKALKINEELDDKKGIAYNYGNIGIIYTLQSDYDKALNYYLKSFEINEILNNKAGIIKDIRRIGGVYLEQSNYPKALEYFQKSLKLSEEIDDKNEMAMTLGSIGIIYTEQLDYIKALESYEKALKYNQEIGKKRGIAYDYLSLGILYQIISEDSTLSRDTKELKNVSLDREVNLNKSINYLLEAEILYKKMNSLIELSRLYNTLYKAYYQKGNYKASIDAHVNYKNLQDSIFSKEKTDKIAELEKVREDDVNRIQIEKQKVQLAAQESEKMFIVYSGVGIVGFIIAILIIIVYQRKKSDKLLYNVLPISIAKRLKKKEHPISDHFVQASIIFIDIVGFTAMSKNSDPTDIVQALNKIFTHYDNIASRHGLEKIKTIGDCYMAAAGIPVIQKDNTLRAARMAIEVRDYMVDYYTDHGFKLDVRIGLDCGPVVAGVIGEKKFIYDMWSDAVNTASRMESTGQSGSVHISERFKEVVAEFDEFEFEARGEMEVKGKGLMNTYFIEYRKAEVV